MTAAWILRRARRQVVAQRRALGIAAAAFSVLVLVVGSTVLGSRATRGWVESVERGVGVIAFLREEMTADQASEMAELLRRLPGVARVRVVEPAEALERLRAAARTAPGTDSWMKDLEPGYFPRSIELAMVATTDLPERAADLSRRLRGVAGVAGVDSMAEGVARLGAWARFGQRLGWAVVLAGTICALCLLFTAVLRGRVARREQAKVLVLLGETARNIRMPASIALAAAGFAGAVAGLLMLRLAWPGFLAAVERALGITHAPLGVCLGFWESALCLLAAPVFGWACGYLSTPVMGWADA